MKFCPECGCENVDDAQFCRNCGARFKQDFSKENAFQPKPAEDIKVVVQDNGKNSIITKLFYKTDKYSGELRIAKIKSISIAVFIFFFLFAAFTIVDSSIIVIILASIIVGLVFAVQTFIIGFVIGFVIDKITH